MYHFSIVEGLFVFILGMSLLALSFLLWKHRKKIALNYIINRRK